MDQTVYFADKAVMFTSEIPAGDDWTLVEAGTEGVCRTKVTKILETHNSVAVLSCDPGAAFAAFAAEFTLVEAAGGIVVNDCGEWLMMHRNGRWDLPKGHLESNESIEECAVREIAEETGVKSQVVRPLCQTLHAYYFPRLTRWELKRTHWFQLHAITSGGLCPQTEEGIECVAWCTPIEVAQNLRGTFPTIRCVAAAMEVI